MEKIVFFWTLLKSVSAVGFSGKATVLESASFYSQMLGANIVGLVLGQLYCHWTNLCKKKNVI